MAFRTFIACILLALAYFAFEIVRLVWIQHSLVTARDIHTGGAADGDITLVSFVDYECTLCQDAHPIVMQAVARDGRVKFLPRPIGHVHEDGYYLSRLVYAAGKQGKFMDMHDALLTNYRFVDEAVLKDLTANVGVDMDQLLEDYESKEVIKLADKNEKLFKRLGLKYTPSYAVGKKIVFSPPEGKMSVDDFLNVFNEARGRQ